MDSNPTYKTWSVYYDHEGIGAFAGEPSVGHMIKVHNPKFKSTSNKINKYLFKVYACLT